MKILIRFIVVLAALVAIAKWLENAREHNQKQTVLANYPGSTAPSAPVDPWTYSTTDDPMGKAPEHEARIASSNAFEFDFPYKGAQHAIILLRTSPRSGRDVMLQISKGQILCRISSCAINVRFDDAQAQTWPAAPSSDGDSTVIFLRNHDAFVARLAKAKILRVQPTIFREGNVVMEFPVAGFSATKYAGK